MCSIKIRNLIKIICVSALIVSIVCGICTFARNDYKFVLPDTSRVESGTSRYTQYVSETETLANRLSLDGFEKKMESSNLELWFRSQIDGIRIVDKRSGYIWGCMLQDSMDNMNEYWSGMANSLLTIEYFDSQYNTNRTSLNDIDVEKRYEWQDNQMVCYAKFSEIGIELAFILELKDDSLTVQMKKASLVESGENKLKSMYFLPFLGSSGKGELNGYFFIPDGPGALMRFNGDSSYNSGYDAKIYGADIGIDTVNYTNDLIAKRPNDYLKDEEQATVPVFGIVHGSGQNAIFSVIDSGENYASVTASLSGNDIDYNWISARFDFRQIYYHPTSKSGNGILRPQDSINAMLPTQTFYFLTGETADYSGMAVKYRSLLEDEGILEKNNNNGEIPLRLNLVISDIHSGVLFDTTQTFTTIDQANEIRVQLFDAGVKNLRMSLEGWQRGGVSANRYGTSKLQKSAGNMKKLTTLRDTLNDTGGNLYLKVNPVNITEKQGRIADLAVVKLSRETAYYLNNNQNAMFKELYIVRPVRVSDALMKLTDKLTGFNFELASLGTELYSDYNDDTASTRTATARLFFNTLKAIRKDQTELALSNPNLYLWEYCNEYYDMPMSNSQYLFESDSVPFLPIVLKGYINYYSPYVNQGFYSQACILKMIEYGAYPSFIAMAENNEKLIDTPMVDYFSLNYDDWSSAIIDVYEKVGKVLPAVEGACITRHEAVKSGVICVNYDNGVCIYINYNSNEETVDGISVPGLSYYVDKGEAN